MLRSGLIGGDNGSPKLLTLGPAQPSQLENTNYVSRRVSAYKSTKVHANMFTDTRVADPDPAGCLNLCSEDTTTMMPGLYR